MSELLLEMDAYVASCRRAGDKRGALEIVATSGLWSAREIIQAWQLSR